MLRNSQSCTVLPSLPGYTKKTPGNPNIVKAFEVINGVCIDKTTLTKTELRDGIPHSIKFGHPHSNQRNALSKSQSTTTLKDPSIAPEYGLYRQKQDRDAYDDPRDVKSKPLPFYNAVPLKAPFLSEDRVLKFHGYFQEAVKESPDETERVRRVDIYYYLLDHTMHLEEPLEPNSGIPQGRFHRREKLCKPNGQKYVLKDLFIGSTIELVGRHVHIVDCDHATRKNLEALGYGIQPDALPYPVPVRGQQPGTESIRGGDFSQNYGKKLTSMKYFMEASLGQNVQTKVNANQPTSVLRFYLLWQHEGDRSTYSMHFYMYDKTVEIIEDKVANSGKEEFPKLLARRKMPKNHLNEIYNDADRGVEANNPPGYYYDIPDLKIGASINVWGRTMTIIGCDNFTRDFYKKTYGLTNEELQPIPVQTTPRKVYERIPPPHLGIGSEEDSLASWYHLHPRKPKRDLKKLAEWDGKMLQFAAVPLNGPGVKQGRKFSIKFFLGDDTLGIYDVPVKNSGLTAGCFLRRGKFRHPTEKRYFAPSDFTVGATIEIEKHQFLLTYADEYTQSYIAGTPLEATASDVQVLTATMKFKLWQKNKSMGFLREAFRHVDENSDSKITLDELTKYLQNSCCRGKVLDPDSAAEIFKLMDVNHDGEVDFKEFCDAFAEGSKSSLNVGELRIRGKHVSADEVAPILHVLAVCLKSHPKLFDKLVKRQIPGNTDQINAHVLRDSLLAINRHFNTGLNQDSIQDLLEYLHPNGIGYMTSEEFYTLLHKV